MEAMRICGRLAATLLLLAGPAGAMAQALPDFTVLVEDNAPAIVNVSTLRPPSAAEQEQRRSMEELLRYFYGDEAPEGGLPDLGGDSPLPPRARQRAAMGSGFIIAPDGYIVTNHHVVDGASEITVTLNDQREFTAELIGSDDHSDLALLKIQADGLPTVALASARDLKVGEWVLAIGSPFGLSYSVAAGIVSYIGRNLPAREEVGDYVSYIQTDVAINPGHSGGPLFNLDGEVVGINSQIFTNSGGSIGLSFAIPVDVASNVIAQLLDTGSVSRGWMGVAIGEVSPELAEAFNLNTPHGALVNQVLDQSPAQTAGFRSGDIIVAFNGHAIRTSGDLPYQVGLTAPGTEVPVDIIRNGNAQQVSMTVGNLDEAARVLSRAAPTPELNRLGVAVTALEDELRRQLELDHGVVVEAVLGDVGREAGLREGDILIAINNSELSSVAAFEEVVADLPAGRLLPVLVARGGRQSFFTVKIPE